MTLTTNCETALWLPTRDHMRGAWIEVQNITQTLLATEEPALQRVLSAQVECVYMLPKLRNVGAHECRRTLVGSPTWLAR